MSEPHGGGLQRPAGGSHGAPAYAGVGSRQTPRPVLDLIESLAERLARLRWVLRTGASPGADQAFYAGACAGGGHVELYLPWQGFEQASWSDAPPQRVTVLAAPSPQAYELAARLQPGWDRLDRPARDLLARDCHQLLGADLRSPARMVVCWTADGSLDGEGEGANGTRQALRIASRQGTSVFNLARAEHALELDGCTREAVAGIGVRSVAE